MKEKKLYNKANQQTNQQATDYDILDVEDYRSEDNVFSHQALVMRAMNKCIELGSKELIEGFYDESQKSNKGVSVVIYKEDTRRAFIESVKTTDMIMVCDYDTEATTNILKLIEDLKITKQELLDKQKDFWNNLGYKEKEFMLRELKYPPPDDFFHSQLHYWNLFIDEELETYRNVFKELSLLTRRINFYEQGIVED